MTKTNFSTKIKKIVYAFLALTLIFTAFIPSGIASAGQITPRKVAVSDATGNATGVTYTFTFTLPSATTVKSFSAQACDQASGTCTQSGNAAGFSSASSGTLPSQPTNLGSGGTWTASAATTTQLRALNNTNTGSPSALATVTFQGVHNPTASNATMFLRLTSYSDSAWTTPIDTGVVAMATSGSVTVTAAVDETLSVTLAASTVALGTLSTSSTGTGTSSIVVATNAATGYSVAYNSGGNSLTSAGGSITAMAGGGSSQNSKQFGINLMANTTPSIGTAVSGGGSGAALTGYNTANSFKFLLAGDTIASASLPTNTNTFTVSYIANIDGATASGAYQVVINYIVTANF